MSLRLRSVLDQVIRTAQSGRVEEILLAIRWDQRRLVDSIVTALRVVPIPKYPIAGLQDCSTKKSDRRGWSICTAVASG